MHFATGSLSPLEPPPPMPPETVTANAQRREQENSSENRQPNIKGIRPVIRPVFFFGDWNASLPCGGVNRGTWNPGFELRIYTRACHGWRHRTQSSSVDVLPDNPPRVVNRHGYILSAGVFIAAARANRRGSLAKGIVPVRRDVREAPVRTWRLECIAFLRALVLTLSNRQRKIQIRP